MCIDIVEILFGIDNRQISSIFFFYFFFYCDIAGLGLYTTKLVFSGKLRSVDGAEAPHFRCMIEIKNIFKSYTYQNFLDDLLTLFMLNPDISCLCKQCRSRSVGF